MSRESLFQIHTDMITDHTEVSAQQSEERQRLKTLDLKPLRPQALAAPRKKWFGWEYVSLRPDIMWALVVTCVIIAVPFMRSAFEEDTLVIKGSGPVVKLYKKKSVGSVVEVKDSTRFAPGDRLSFTVLSTTRQFLYAALLSGKRRLILEPKQIGLYAVLIEPGEKYLSKVSFELDSHNQGEIFAVILCEDHEGLSWSAEYDAVIHGAFEAGHIDKDLDERCVKKEWQLR